MQRLKEKGISQQALENRIAHEARRLIAENYHVTGRNLEKRIGAGTPEFLEQVWQKVYRRNPAVKKITIPDRVALRLEKHLERCAKDVHYRTCLVETLMERVQATR